MSVAVVSPAAQGFVSALLPAQIVGAATEWEWYHRCLAAIGDVAYFGVDEWDRVAGFDTVLVHEALEAVTPGWTVSALGVLRSRNGKVVWVEPHERTTFGAPVFEPGFFDAVDAVRKLQLMEYGALVSALTDPDNNLAPWALYGHTSIGAFYADQRLFALPTSAATIDRHVTCDLSDRYGDRIAPMMRLFTTARPNSWYDGPPGRHDRIRKETGIGIVSGDGAAMTVRGVLAGALGQVGLDVKLFWSRVRAAAASEACVAIGPVHLDQTAADVTRFETIALHPEDDRYLRWDDAFVPYESYIPLAGFGRLFSSGGRVIDGRAANELGERVRDDLADAELRERVLAGQRRAHAMLTDPYFVAGKLGVDAARPVVEPVAPRAFRLRESHPVALGSISSDDVSVVIQGAIGRDDFTEEVVDSVRAHLPGAEVVLSTWEGQRDLSTPVDRRVESTDPGAAWQAHEEWPSNVNRLLVSTAAGLAACTRPYTLKLRTDTPVTGTGFAQIFRRHPERGDAVRILRDRIVVINYYCWNPASRPFGLFTVADTVQFGWTDDLRDVWDRPLDPEPATSIWFESHPRPVPERCRWAVFRYNPEQLFWVGFLRNHVEVPFEHFSDVTPASWLLAELSIANNVVIVGADEFGVGTPKFAGRDQLEPGAVYSRPMWEELYARYSTAGFDAATALAGVGLDPDRYLRSPAVIGR